MSSALLDLPGAVSRVTQPGGLQKGIQGLVQHETAATSDPDDAIAWHYGDPIGEQRAAEDRSALFDLSHREVLAITGEDRLSWLHTLTTQALDTATDGTVTQALLLSPTGHVEHQMGVTVLGDTVYLDTEPGRGEALRAFLESMKFWSKVEIGETDLGLLRITGPERAFAGAPEIGAASLPEIDGFGRVSGTAIEIAVPAGRIGAVAAGIVAAGTRAAGSWAADALRIPTREPRLGIDTDERTIPNETGWLESAVHLNKGCYRGQETVARVNNLGRPPRRLVMLNLDGSVDRLPANGSAVLTVDGGRQVGRVGSVGYHHELGPIALALIKRTLPVDTPLLADGVDALIDPDGYADAADSGTEGGSPRSAIDRKALPNIRRR
ncbi:CAF17-like 4Fe-4S cluster assembly/insertion protein YgfZ [Nakamurella lactea]|uniref:CAF17-like 4Fe-4S cluster assembly/insertion protein YgfZ n=1 Tax=Nakamurella lactea TaxID=459515 RepID=UPI00040391BE|nr:folate-binding protein YgfZ [Nakamurella lactea]